MAGNEQIKICPLCAESIKAAAKVCPHCRSIQKKWSLRNPQVNGMCFAVIYVLIFAGLLAWIVKAFGPKEDFAEYKNEINVVNSQFSQRMAGSNLMVTVVGTLTNHSAVGWKDVGVEAQFFDTSGKLIDAITVNANDYKGVVILPRSETSFKIEGRASHPAADYFTNELNVRWAKDANALF